ncbi:hypothetical protein Tco_0729732 [Tanacetum coccineum]|uniref:Uncharacterized protein n=1 Tax=Tanacetum coccineum TaxID=301880 RepID=A0ABQ4YQX1_9ASTR
MSTRFNIKRLDGNGVQNHGDSKQVGFEQLVPCVKTGVHGLNVQKRVWFKVKLQGSQEYREGDIIQDSNDDVERVYLGAKVDANIMENRVPIKRVQREARKRRQDAVSRIRNTGKRGNAGKREETPEKRPLKKWKRFFN